MAGTGKGVLRVAIEDFLETFSFGKIIGIWYKEFIEGLESEAMDVYDKIARLYYPDGNFPPPFDPANVRPIVVAHQNGIWLWLVAMGGLVLGGAFGFGQPSARLAAYSMDQKLHTYRPQPADAWAMARHDKLDIATLSEIFDDVGIAPELFEGYRSITQTLLSPLDYVTAWRRGKLSEGELNTTLAKAGLELPTIETLKQITEVIPNIGDLIRMSVREAFSPAVIQRFGYDEAFPSDVLQYTKQQGLSEEWVRRFWYSHWEIPSPNQGFEMLHRLRVGRTQQNFTADDLDLLLKTADYAPFFRDRLKAISYNPITRVDIRRMYKLGIFDAKEVKERYMDIGYSDNDAQKLADFTVKYETESGQNKNDQLNDLSESLAKRLYTKKIITKDDYKKRLSDLKYTDDVIELIVKLADQEIAEDLIVDYRKAFISDMVNDAEKAYAARMITKESASNTLSSLGISQESINYIIQKQDYQADLDDLNSRLKLLVDSYLAQTVTRDYFIGQLGQLGISGAQQDSVISSVELQLKFRSRRLTETQYRAAALASIITTQDYKSALVGLGYSDYDIDLLVALYITNPSQ